jgi:hypothetical protein
MRPRAVTPFPRDHAKSDTTADPADPGNSPRTYKELTAPAPVGTQSKETDLIQQITQIQTQKTLLRKLMESLDQGGMSISKKLNSLGSHRGMMDTLTLFNAKKGHVE